MKNEFNRSQDILVVERKVVRDGTKKRFKDERMMQMKNLLLPNL